jgi:capsule polysaccharide export protein KpsE/RkpR
VSLHLWPLRYSMSAPLLAVRLTRTNPLTAIATAQTDIKTAEAKQRAAEQELAKYRNSHDSNKPTTEVTIQVTRMTTARVTCVIQRAPCATTRTFVPTVGE